MLKVDNICKSYKKPSFFSQEKMGVLKNISFKMKENECLGIIGESGSGKSTLARLILGIESVDSGEIIFNGNPVKKGRRKKGEISVVFQDYTSSLNQNATVYESIKNAVSVLDIEFSKEEIIKLLNDVGLNSQYLERYPHELSGGETQRVCIARAISTKPKMIVLDEAISSLDVAVQVTILDLLKKIKEEYRLSYLFITHDIQAAAYMCDSLIILRTGEIVENLEIRDIRHAEKEYSKKLFESVLMI